MFKNTETRVGLFVLIALGVFAYMGLQIGAFRFDRGKYNTYELYFKDISGLSRKADVKIAGVKVGWVEKINLIPNGTMTAQAKISICNTYTLYTNAYALVRQDGLLGPKYIEIIPGDHLLSPLQSGDTLSKPSIEQPSVDELMMQFKTIATDVQQVTHSFKEVLGGPQGEDQLRGLMNNLSNTAEKISQFADMVQNTVLRNDERIDDLFSIGTNIKQITQTLQTDVFPSFQTSIEKISNVFDRDFDRIANSLTSTSESLTETASEAKAGLRSISSVAEKIDEGKGLLGKLINEDETYYDIKYAVQGFKNYIAKMDHLQIVFDSHFESMHRVAENYRYEDSKGYFDIRIHPNEDYFYLVQIATSEKGRVARKELIRNYVDSHLNPIDTSTIDISGFGLLEEVIRKQETKIQRNTVRLGIQFGKIFKDIAFRFGLIEGSAGFGIDVDIPFKTEKFRWVTTFEAFDMTGQNRIDDRRPHLKWLNKMYIMRNFYLTFGADDFVSKHNSSAFVGGGIRFGDNDVKYLLSGLSGVSSSLTS